MADHPKHLAEVTPSVLAALGVAGESNTLGFAPVRRACVLLIDGLGWELLGAHAHHAPFLAELAAAAEPLRTGIPATTAAGLAAVGTGVPSGEHGMIGYSFALSQQDAPDLGNPDAGDSDTGHSGPPVVLNALRWCSHGDGVRADLRGSAVPEQVQPRTTTFERAERAGITTSVVSSAQFNGSGLTRAVLRGGRYVGVHGAGDLAAEANAALREAPSFCYAYHGELDLLGHLYGPGSPAWRMQLGQVDRLVESIASAMPPDSLLSVVADHGMVWIDDYVDVDAESELTEGVRALGGEVRVRHLYTEYGATGDVLAAWRSTLGPRASVVTGTEAIEHGWFGPRVSDNVRSRIGDVVAAANNGFGMLRRSVEPGESALLGQHGSMTPAEQLVPLLCAYR